MPDSDLLLDASGDREVHPRAMAYLRIGPATDSTEPSGGAFPWPGGNSFCFEESTRRSRVPPVDNTNCCRSVSDTRCLGNGAAPSCQRDGLSDGLQWRGSAVLGPFCYWSCARVHHARSLSRRNRGWWLARCRLQVGFGPGWGMAGYRSGTVTPPGIWISGGPGGCGVLLQMETPDSRSQFTVQLTSSATVRRARRSLHCARSRRRQAVCHFTCTRVAAAFAPAHAAPTSRAVSKAAVPSQGFICCSSSAR